MGSIKAVVSEAIEGHEEYHLLVSTLLILSHVHYFIKFICYMSIA